MMRRMTSSTAKKMSTISQSLSFLLSPLPAPPAVEHQGSRRMSGEGHTTRQARVTPRVRQGPQHTHARRVLISQASNDDPWQDSRPTTFFARVATRAIWEVPWPHTEGTWNFSGRQWNGAQPLD